MNKHHLSRTELGIFLNSQRDVNQLDAVGSSRLNIMLMEQLRDIKHVSLLKAILRKKVLIMKRHSLL